MDKAKPYSYCIINHGWDHCQYFQGQGTTFTGYDHVETGIGNNAKEAYEDAVEQIYLSWDLEVVSALHLPLRPRGIRQADKVPAKAEECYWYVSILYTFGE